MRICSLSRTTGAEVEASDGARESVTPVALTPADACRGAPGAHTQYETTSWMVPQNTSRNRLIARLK